MDVRTEAEHLLKQSVIFYEDEPVGTVASLEKDELERDQVNYGQCFIRDFVPSGIAFLMTEQTEDRKIVRNFLETALALQLTEHGTTNGKGLFAKIRNSLKQKPQVFDWIEPGPGLMPASFYIKPDEHGEQYIERDFGQHAIGRVTPVDSGLWWIFLLNAYEKACDRAGKPAEKIAHNEEVRAGICAILELGLQKRFDTTPLMLVPEASFMIDRRFAVYGHPLEIQVLLHFALSTASHLLDPSDLQRLNVPVRLQKLSSYIQKHYWLSASRLNVIEDAPNEQYGLKVKNEFNIFPASLRNQDWVADWLNSHEVGYLVGNVGISWIDFRFFTQGNLLAILSGLSTPQQSEMILNLIEKQWSKLVGKRPMKICYPALEGAEYEILTGCDDKNKPWSYHNAGSWPVLLWPLAAATGKMGRLHLLAEAINSIEDRLPKDQWPEFYSGKEGERLGRRRRDFQTWTISGYLVAKYLLERPELISILYPGN